MKLNLKLIGLISAFIIGQWLAAETYASGSCGVLPVPPAGCSSQCQCDSKGLNCSVVVSCRF